MSAPPWSRVQGVAGQSVHHVGEPPADGTDDPNDKERAESTATTTRPPGSPYQWMQHSV